MKTTGDRIRHVRENLLGMTQQELLKVIEISPRSLSAMEQNEGGERSMRDVVRILGLSEVWLKTGKGSIWLTGTDEENVARIKSMKSGTQSGANDQAVEELKVELVRYREREDRLQRIIDKLIGGNNSFRKALSGTSYAKTA